MSHLGHCVRTLSHTAAFHLGTRLEFLPDRSIYMSKMMTETKDAMETIRWAEQALRNLEETLQDIRDHRLHLDTLLAEMEDR